MENITILPHSTDEAFQEFLYYFLEDEKQGDFSYKITKDNTFDLLNYYATINYYHNGIRCEDIIIIQKDLHLLSYHDLVETNEIAQTLFEEEGIYGVEGVRDSNLLHSIVNILSIDSYFGEPYHPTVLEKAAYLWYSIANYHCFFNGNKRTSLLCAIDFLNQNGYNLKNSDEMELYRVTVEIVEKMNDHSKLLEWLKKNVYYTTEFISVELIDELML